MERKYRYVIAGGGLAGASAIKGIRELDKEGSILMLSAEAHRPYDRPPLSKKLWTGKKKVEEIFIDPPGFYEASGVDLALGARATALDTATKTVATAQGQEYGYDKLLLATGGSPRRLDIPGGGLEEAVYYRYLDDYTRLRALAKKGASATVVGGGFIGSEVAAALSVAGVAVTMVFPSPYLCSRVFPEGLGMAVQADFERRGIRVLSGDSPVSFERKGGRVLTRTGKGKALDSEILVVGAGIKPSVELALKAGIEAGDGITVDGFLRASAPEVFAAGDCASFPYKALGTRTRVEHWDNALAQGALAGRNMAGAAEAYDYMPYFFSDLFDLGYEAVGEVSSSLETFADWQAEFSKGVIYYHRDGQVRGVMLCNVWDRVEAARSLIREGGRRMPESLKGAIA